MCLALTTVANLLRVPLTALTVLQASTVLVESNPTQVFATLALSALVNSHQRLRVEFSKLVTICQADQVLAQLATIAQQAPVSQSLAKKDSTRM